jgi:hypothetical protein
MTRYARLGLLMAALLGLAACAGDVTGGDDPARESAYSAAVKKDRPIAWWRMEELSGTMASDSSGFGRNGTYIASPVMGVVVGERLGLGLNLTQSVNGDGIFVPYGKWMDLDSATIELWVRPNRVTYTDAVLMLAKGNVWQMQVTKDGRPAFIYTNGNGGRATTPFVLGQLYHVVGTFVPGTTPYSYLRLYVNGEFVGEAPTVDQRLPRDTLMMEIGRGQSSFLDFVGLIDEVALYDRALGVDRIKAHYEAGR